MESLMEFVTHEITQIWIRAMTTDRELLELAAKYKNAATTCFNYMFTPEYRKFMEHSACGTSGKLPDISAAIGETL